jgi:dCMP deaminase
MIIGLTGSLAAGKGVVSDFLKEQGFIYLSLSDELRERLKQGKVELTRENLQKWGNRLREEYGSSVLAKLVSEKINAQKYNNSIIDGIRNPAEIQELRKLKNFFLVSVDAPLETRFRRMVTRNRESDPKTFEEFLKVDAKDKGMGELETGQGVGKCMEQADFTLINDGTLEEVKQKIKNLYEKIELKIPRSTWDEYFMKMSMLIGERSTCLRHHIGAIIVKEKRVLTTGYNGAAKGVKDCIELGCLRNKLNIPSGTRHEVCRAIHAEQNALIQAGVHGININNSTLYCTHTPCMICAKMIVNAGIKEVVSYHDYADEEARRFLKDAGILLRKVNRPESTIKFKD